VSDEVGGEGVKVRDVVAGQVQESEFLVLQQLYISCRTCIGIEDSCAATIIHKLQDQYRNRSF